MAKAHVLVFPFPAQGHMLPLLDLAGHLSSGGLAVTVVVTARNLPFLSPLLTRSPSIHPLVLPFPDDPSIPPGVENMMDLPPFYFYPMMRALAALHAPLLRWYLYHPSPPTAILSDMFLGWTTSLASEMGIPRICFSPSGALAISILHYLWREMPDRKTPQISFPSIPGSPVYPLNHLFMMYRMYREGDPLWEFTRDGFLQNMRSWGYVLNTFDALEGRYLEHLRKEMGHRRVWAAGPLCLPDAAAAERGGAASVPAAEVLAWLDGFEDGTVVYVSFGSQAVLPPPAAAVLAAALEMSGVRFVWSARGEVAEGLEERTAGRGMVIRGWAPQVAVLGHRAVGWFLTHCGWNSAMEAAAAGVAMLTWPLTADQYMGARLLVEEAGVAVRAWEGFEAAPEPEELARLLGETVGGQKGRPVRARAVELRRKALAAVGEGGSSDVDFAEMVTELRMNMLSPE